MTSATAKPTLIVMAAGMGSRYGGVKQVDGFGPSGETILEYSIYDAIKAGFGKIVLIIREDIREAVHAIVAPVLDGRIDWEFVIQDGNKHVPPHFQNPDRSKPWGTGHAVLCASDVVNEPFAVINADDFYGASAFRNLADFLTSDSDPNRHAIVGYKLGNVLSDFGTVSRGVCEMDAEGNLQSVTERTKIARDNGKIIHIDGETTGELQSDTVVSMNFWGFKPSYFELSKAAFNRFLEKNHTDLKNEFYIPLAAQDLIDSGTGKIAVLEGGEIWFGVTYPQDKPYVQEQINRLVSSGAYPENLWA